MTYTKTLQEGLQEINNFIKKWTGENASHLLDNDENDGQRLRNTFTTFAEKIRVSVEGDIEKWANTEIGYIDEQMNIEKEEDLIEYLTGKKNLANDLLAKLKDK